MVRRIAILGFMIVSGCTTSALVTPLPQGSTIDVTVSGAVKGTFPANLRVAFNQPGDSGFTSVQLLRDGVKELGIDHFAVSANLLGEPESRHYDGMESGMYVTLRMTDGRAMQSNVNSINELDVTGIAGTSSRDDGSVLLALTGSMAGWASSTESPDSIQFSASF